MHIHRPSSPRALPIVSTSASASQAAEVAGARASNALATLQHNPRVNDAINAGVSIYFDPDVLAPRLREITILRMAWNTGSEYEFGQHRLIARQVGLSDPEIEFLTLPTTAFQWVPSELAVIQMVDSLYVDDCVDEQGWRNLSAEFSVPDIIALIGVAGCYRMAAGLFNSLGIQLDEGVSGWPPAR